MAGAVAAGFDTERLVAFGGGRRGAFLLLRYVFIIAACYLLLFETPAGTQAPAGTALMVSLALASNVALSCLSLPLLTWYVEAPVLVADALWVSWALHSTGAVGGEFFLLYIFVLFLAAAGRHLPLALAGSVVVGVVHTFYVWDRTAAPSHLLLRVCFFFAVTLFYGTVLTELRRERSRGDQTLSWAQLLRREVAKATTELQYLYQQARSATRVRDEFVAAMSHELRTPIHIILGYAEMLADMPDPLELREVQLVADRIGEAGLKLKRLVDGVLDLSRLDRGRESVHLESVCVDAMLEELRWRDRPAPRSGVSVRWEAAPNLPALETDAQKLGIVLENLVGNAFRFTTQGTVSIRADYDRAGDRLLFSVTDTGPGIPPALLANLWEPFQRTALETGEDPAGTGIGLAIAKRYVDLLGGSIRATSHVGHGTRMEVSLPRRARIAAAVLAAPVAGAEAER